MVEVYDGKKCFAGCPFLRHSAFTQKMGWCRGNNPWGEVDRSRELEWCWAGHAWIGFKRRDDCPLPVTVEKPKETP